VGGEAKIRLPCIERMPSKKRRLYQGIYNYTQETKFRFAKSSQGQID